MQLRVPYRYGQKKPYGSIPRIDRSHPLAFGLQFYGYDVGGTIIDLVGGKQSAAITTRPGRGNTKVGSGINYGFGVAMPAITGQVGTLTAPYSFAAGIFPTAAPGLSSAIFGNGDSTGANNAFSFVQNASATSFIYGWNNGANNDTLTVASATNGYHSMCAVAPTSTTTEDYWDGALNTSNGASSTNTVLTGEQYVFDSFAFGSQVNNDFVGFIYYGAYWSRRLTATEARQLHDDPWCFLIYPEDEMFATLVGVIAAAGNPFLPVDSQIPHGVRAALIDQSVSLNLNLFKNPIPIFNQFEPAKPFRLPLAMLAPPLPLNINLFTNPFPFNQSDWSKPTTSPRASIPPPDTLNINLFTNAYPFAQYDWSKPVRSPLAMPTPPLPLNINVFTNPFPFNQTDWSKPIKAPQAPYSPTDPLNINLFTNPFPVLNFDAPRPLRVRGVQSPDIPYNQNLYTVTVATAPFYAAEIFPARRQVATPLPDQPLNINLFTNPYPFFNSDQSSSRPPARTSSSDVPYNQNLYSVTVVASLPFNQYDWPIPRRIIPSQLPTAPLNINLFTNPYPFNQTDWAKSVRVPQASYVPTDPLNVNLFTNPFPVFNSDQSSSRPFLRNPSVDAPYNQNLYSVSIVTAPFYAAEIFPVRRPVASPKIDPPLNINLFTNPYPFNQSDWSKPVRTPQAPFSPDPAPLNLNLFTNPIPFNQMDWSRPFAVPVRAPILDSQSTTFRGASTFSLSGMTITSTGTPIPFCTVLLFRTSDDAFIATTTSDAGGNYSFTGLPSTATNYFVNGYLTGAPDLFGTTSNKLTPS